MAKKLAFTFGSLLVISNLVWAYIALEQDVHIGYLASDVRSISQQKASFKQVCDKVYSDITVLQAKKITQNYTLRRLLSSKKALYIQTGILFN